jgi:hypothetical protein
LGSDAIGEIIQPIVREIKYSVAHESHGSRAYAVSSAAPPDMK